MMVTKTFMVHLNVYRSTHTQTSPEKIHGIQIDISTCHILANQTREPAYMKYKMQKYDRFCLAANIQVCSLFAFF